MKGVILDDVEAGLTVLTQLKQLGTEIAIDDFGRAMRRSRTCGASPPRR
jgi:EAL domain-containing protein (putative c-di-GMP-specific phosphodiesterase class I)